MGKHTFIWAKTQSWSQRHAIPSALLVELSHSSVPSTSAQPAPGAQVLSLRRKIHSAACQNEGSKIAPAQCNHPPVQSKKHNKWKEIQGLPQPELPFYFPFLFNRNHSHSQVQPISTVRASNMVTLHSFVVIVVIFDVSFPLFLLRAPYLWDMLFFTLGLQLSNPCGHRSDLTPQPSIPESHPLSSLLKFWRTMQSGKMKDESRPSVEQFTRQYILITASCTAGHAHI